MTKNNIAALQQFISCNSLTTDSGLFVFDATIIFFKDTESHTVNSRVQFIKLPDAMAVYIFEFFNEGYGQPDMYSTNKYHFNCTEANVLEISLAGATTLLLVSIKVR